MHYIHYQRRVAKVSRGLRESDLGIKSVATSTSSEGTNFIIYFKDGSSIDLGYIPTETIKNNKSEEVLKMVQNKIKGAENRVNYEIIEEIIFPSMIGEIAVVTPDLKKDIIKEENGEIKLTKLGMYILYSQANKMFKDRIFDLDESEKFSRRKQELDYDKEELIAALSKYQGKKDLYTDLMEKWAKENADKYTTIAQIPNISKYLTGFVFNYDGNLEEAVQGYKYTEFILKNTDWSDIRTVRRRALLPEFKEEYEAAKKNAELKSGWYGKAKVIEEIGIEKTVPVTKHRLALNRQKYDRIVPQFYTYSESILSHLIKTDLRREER